MGPGGSGHGAARPVLSDGILTLRSDKAIALCGARPTVKEVEVPLPRSHGHQRWAVPVTHNLRGGHVDPSLALPLQQQHGRAQRWAGRPHTGLTPPHWPDPGGSKDVKQGRGARRPSALPVLEETEGFVCPHPNEAFHGQGLQGPQRLEDAAHPPRHLAGRVDVVGLRVLREPLLHRPGGRRRERRETRTGVKGQTPRNTFTLRIKNPDPGIAQGGSSNAGTTGQLSGAVRPKLLILW